MVPQPLRGSAARLSERRGEPDIPGRNWNGIDGGPNTNVGGFAGTTWAMVEAGACPVELTYELETVGRNDFFGTLPGAFTAHPKVDPATGEMHAMVYALPSGWTTCSTSSSAPTEGCAAPSTSRCPA